MAQSSAHKLTAEDVTEIHQLNSHYALAIDDLVPDPGVAFAATFAADGSWTLLDAKGTVLLEATGTAKLIELHGNLPNRSITRHWFNNLFIEPDGKDAKMTSFIMVMHVW